MTQEIQEIAAWMRACVLANNPRDIERWDIATLRAVFHTLPQNARADFDTWLAGMRGNSAAAAAPATPPNPDPQPTQEQIEKVNGAFISALESGFCHKEGQENELLKERLRDEDAARKAAGIADQQFSVQTA